MDNLPNQAKPQYWLTNNKPALTTTEVNKSSVFNQIKRALLPGFIIGVVVGFFIYIYMVVYVFVAFKSPENRPWYSVLFFSNPFTSKSIQTTSSSLIPNVTTSQFSPAPSPVESPSSLQKYSKAGLNQAFDNYGFSFVYNQSWRIGNWNQFQKNTQLHSQILSLERLVKPVYATPEYNNYTPIPWQNSDSVFALWLQNPLWDDSRKNLEEKYNQYPTYYQIQSYNGAPQGIYINVWAVNNVTTIDQLRNLYQNDYNVIPAETKTINGFQALVLKSNTVYPPEEKDMYPLYVWGQEATIFAANNYLYSVFYAGDKYRDNYDQILTTLKFTETGTTTNPS